VTLALDLAGGAAVTVTVHDAAGRLVATPVAGERLGAGRTLRPWRARLPAGAYWVRAVVDGRAESRRVVWLGGP
jgi:hypothetical protein